MRKMISMTTAIALVAAMALSGCGSKPASSTTPAADAAKASSTAGASQAAKEPVEISLWYTANESDPNDRDHAWLSETVELFQKANPTVTVKTTIIGGAGGDDYRTKLSAEIAANNAPDVFLTWSWDRMKPFVDAGKLYDLTDLVNNDADLSKVINKDNLTGVTYGGKIYGLPDGADLQGLFYNKKLFADNNLTPPTSTAELIKVAEVFNSKGITPVSLGNSATWVTLIPYSTLLADTAGEAFMKDLAANGPKDFTAPEYTKAMEEVNKLVKANVFTKDFNGIQPPESVAAFKDGQAAMLVQGTWQLKGLEEAMGDNVGYITFPTSDSAKPIVQKVIPKAYAISADTKHPEEAKAFLKFMFSAERQRAYSDKGALVATKNIDIDTASMSALKKDIVKLLESDQKSVHMIDVFCSSNVAVELRKVVQGCTSGANEAESFKKLQAFNEQN